MRPESHRALTIVPLPFWRRDISDPHVLWGTEPAGRPWWTDDLNLRAFDDRNPDSRNDDSASAKLAGEGSSERDAGLHTHVRTDFRTVLCTGSDRGPRDGPLGAGVHDWDAPGGAHRDAVAGAGGPVLRVAAEGRGVQQQLQPVISHFERRRDSREARRQDHGLDASWLG